MISKETTEVKKWHKALLLFFNVVAIFFILTLINLGLIFVYEKKYEHRIYPGISIANISMSGLNYYQAKSLLNTRVDKIKETGIDFVFDGHRSTIYPTIYSVESDLAYDIIVFDLDSVIRQALSYGREEQWWRSLKTKVNLIFEPTNIYAELSLNVNKINENLVDDFSEFETRPHDANLVFKDGEFNISPEKSGEIFDYNLAIKNLALNLRNFNIKDVRLKKEIATPKIKSSQILLERERADDLIAKTPLTLVYQMEGNEDNTYDKEFWKIDRDTLASWIELKNRKDNSGIYIGLNESLLTTYLNEEVALKIDVEPVDAKFEIKDGRVVEFQESKDGKKLNIKSTIAKLEFEIMEDELGEIELVVSEAKSQLKVDETNDLGIREIVGTGYSSFVGSPSNRRHNIRIGSESLNGVIVKPGEELSLLAVLGEIDGKSGYLPELVIKDNKTIPEYGGGLCQVGTTLFRAVTESGLPVTMRRNHSYRVSYYEPAGTDATIYDPWPDFRFVNDMETNILIQARVEGYDLYFDFWGTKDGRKIEKTEPTIYNITAPPSTKYIETLDLEPGKEKCTEHAHNGADAYFEYNVTYPDGELKEKTFSSHYSPWQEVCLIGVEELESEKTASSSDDKTDD